MDRQVGYEEFQDIAQSPGEARLLHKAMKQLADGGAGPAMQEMARDVLAGRTGLRQALSQSAYSPELLAGADSLHDRLSAMSDRERDELAEQGRRFIAQEDREIEDEAREAGEEPPAVRWDYRPGGS
ncbi:hypothetical protein KNE206_24230 [Kitasatospora sp. NE20-6]|uniref:hypothetical protein n=1 Tax=Kitasatospora sp. NE20-6 TaxID=2859066 RepID=UPI0034DBF4A1